MECIQYVHEYTYFRVNISFSYTIMIMKDEWVTKVRVSGRYNNSEPRILGKRSRSFTGPRAFPFPKTDYRM